MIPLFERLRSTAIWMIALPVFGLFCLLVWLLSHVLRGAALETLIKAACRAVLSVCGIRLRIEGRDNIVRGRQYIVMMNHVNFFDPLVLYSAFPGWARGIEEESHFRWPVYGPTIRRLGVIPISRTDKKRALASLERGAEFIRRRPDFSFVVLPEGTRTQDGKLGALKSGGFHLALASGLEILPVVQVGAGRINQKGSLLIRPGKIRFIIECPVATAGFSRENLSALKDNVRSVFLRHLGE
jgi:1-acyl-sn-glycerol-3-phosphate acyltransferase